MAEIDAFCEEHGISQSSTSDSYYFSIGDERYRVSNHTQEASDRGMFHTDPYTGEFIQVRNSYHQKADGSYEYDREHEITAGKTRIIEIYTALSEGKRVDKRGRVIE